MKVALYGRFSMFGQEVRSSNGVSNNPLPG
jgi:hypothetical protein